MQWSNDWIEMVPVDQMAADIIAKEPVYEAQNSHGRSWSYMTRFIPRFIKIKFALLLEDVEAVNRRVTSLWLKPIQISSTYTYFYLVTRKSLNVVGLLFKKNATGVE